MRGEVVRRNDVVQLARGGAVNGDGAVRMAQREELLLGPRCGEGARGEARAKDVLLRGEGVELLEGHRSRGGLKSTPHGLLHEGDDEPGGRSSIEVCQWEEWVRLAMTSLRVEFNYWLWMALSVLTHFTPPLVE